MDRQKPTHNDPVQLPWGNIETESVPAKDIRVGDWIVMSWCSKTTLCEVATVIPQPDGKIEILEADRNGGMYPPENKVERFTGLKAGVGRLPSARFSIDFRGRDAHLWTVVSIAGTDYQAKTMIMSGPAADVLDFVEGRATMAEVEERWRLKG